MDTQLLKIGRRNIEIATTIHFSPIQPRYFYFHITTPAAGVVLLPKIIFDPLLIGKV